MKKLIVGLAAAGGIIAMAAKCKQMMAGHSQAGGMREHCKGMGAKCEEMMAAHGNHGDKAQAPEHSEQEAPQFAGNGEAVTV